MALLIYDPDVPNIERQHEQLAVPNWIILLRSGDAPQHGATMTFSLDFNHGRATESRRRLRLLVQRGWNILQLLDSNREWHAAGSSFPPMPVGG
jgi:hypothetical protein